MGWLIPDWQKTVVYIGQERVNGKKKEDVQIGTGFLLQINTIFYLVTCKHVVVDEGGKEIEIFIKYNSKEGEITKRCVKEIKENWKIIWHFHKNNAVDIAIMCLPLNIEEDNVKIISEDAFLNLNEFNIADEIFLLGHQPGLDTKKIKPIVRSGIVSRIEEDKTFYIDASVFPGNSGSPVLLKPSPITLQGTNMSLGSTHLGKFIGICSGYLPYQDIAISLQTKKPRIIFEENTGLSRVWSVDILKEIFNQKKFKKENERLKKNPKLDFKQRDEPKAEAKKGKIELGKRG